MCKTQSDRKGDGNKSVMLGEPGSTRGGVRRGRFLDYWGSPDPQIRKNYHLFLYFINEYFTILFKNDVKVKL